MRSVISDIKLRFKSKFVKNFFTLFSGSVISQLILFAFIPLLSRLYTEDIFGLLFIFGSLVSILRIIATLRFELTIILPDDERQAINLLIISLLINLVLNLVFLFLVFLFYEFIVRVSGENNIGIWFYFVPVSSFLIGFFEIISSWNNREEKYKRISTGRISKSVLTVGSQISHKFLSLSGNGLIIGSLAGQIFSSLLIFFLSFKSIIKNLYLFSIKESISLFLKYKDIPLYNTLIGGINTLSNQIPFLIFGKYFGIETVAFFGMASRVVMTPTGLVAQSFGLVFYKRAADIINQNGNLFIFVKKTYKNILKLIAFPVIIVFISCFYFDYIFGEEWKRAGLYAAVMLPWITIAFLNNPVTWIITLLNKQKFVLFFDIFLLIARFLSIYLSAIFMFNDIFAVSLFSLTGFLFGIFMFYYLLRIAKQAQKAY